MAPRLFTTQISLFLICSMISIPFVIGSKATRIHCQIDEANKDVPQTVITLAIQTISNSNKSISMPFPLSNLLIYHLLFPRLPAVVAEHVS